MYLAWISAGQHSKHRGPTQVVDIANIINSIITSLTSLLGMKKGFGKILMYAQQQ